MENDTDDVIRQEKVPWKNSTIKPPLQNGQSS